ncbi:DUF6406 domain-containing protein [Streptomyces sp. NPDC046237]|uniref:DUF6406 domain-containing protein n=1 Tax=Streptomyces sp. NPDC046237 TaxID=3154914 RepID=UPI0033F2FF6C
MISEVRMRTGVPAPFGDIEFILAHVQVREGQQPLASFTVVADEEQDYDLVPGDTFVVRGETWVFDRVQDLPDRGRYVVLKRVE